MGKTIKQRGNIWRGLGQGFKTNVKSMKNNKKTKECFTGKNRVNKKPLHRIVDESVTRGGVKKRKMRRTKSVTKAKRDHKRLSSSTEPILKFAPMKRLIREILDSMDTQINRMQCIAYKSIISSADSFLAKIFESVYIVSGKRKTLMQEDLHKVFKILGIENRSSLPKQRNQKQLNRVPLRINTKKRITKKKNSLINPGITTDTLILPANENNPEKEEEEEEEEKEERVEEEDKIEETIEFNLQSEDDGEEKDEETIEFDLQFEDDGEEEEEEEKEEKVEEVEKKDEEEKIDELIEADEGFDTDE